MKHKDKAKHKKMNHKEIFTRTKHKEINHKEIFTSTNHKENNYNPCLTHNMFANKTLTW
jgi:hypothetical protein